MQLSDVVTVPRTKGDGYFSFFKVIASCCKNRKFDQIRIVLEPDDDKFHKILAKASKYKTLGIGWYKQVGRIYIVKKMRDIDIVVHGSALRLRGDYNGLFSMPGENKFTVNVLDVTMLDTDEAGELINMFDGNIGQIVGLNGWRMSNCKSVSNMFTMATKSPIDIHTWNLINCDTSFMFNHAECPSVRMCGLTKEQEKCVLVSASNIGELSYGGKSYHNINGKPVNQYKN
jgi:hypothetical protein